MNKIYKKENYTDYISKLYQEVDENFNYFTTRNITF